MGDTFFLQQDGFFSDQGHAAEQDGCETGRRSGCKPRFDVHRECMLSSTTRLEQDPQGEVPPTQASSPSCILRRLQGSPSSSVAQKTRNPRLAFCGHGSDLTKYGKPKVQKVDSLWASESHLIGSGALGLGISLPPSSAEDFPPSRCEHRGSCGRTPGSEPWRKRWPGFLEGPSLDFSITWVDSPLPIAGQMGRICIGRWGISICPY